MTSLALISSENPSSVAQQNQRIRHFRVINRCKLRRIGHFENISFQITANEAIFLADFTLSGSEFHRVGASTEKARVPALRRLR